MLWVRNYDDLLESWQRQPSLSLSCIKKTKQNNNKKFNDFLSQDYKYNNDKKIIVKKWRPIWSNAKCFHYMVHMDQQTCSLLFITENWKFFRCKNIKLQWKPFCYISIKVWQPITQKRANMLPNIWVRSMQLGF